jgi:hypothetical protein
MRNRTCVLVIVLAVFLATLSLPPRSMVQARELADLNLTERIILVLANSLSPDYQSEPDDMPKLMLMVEDGEIFLDEEEEEQGQGKGMYAYSFPREVADFVGSGYFRIASQARYRKPEEEKGWGLLGEDDATEAKVWFRRVRTDAISYNEVEASLSKGNFVLTVSQRCPPGESAEEARTTILKRFRVLLENAKRYGILADILIELVDEGDEEERKPLEQNALLNIPGGESAPTAARFRIYAADHTGAPLPNVDSYTIELKGFLGPHATLEGAAFNPAKKRYEIHDPPAAGALVTLIFPSFSNNAFAKALEQDAAMDSGFGIVLEVDAEFKPERRELP